jgi:hypothetical protein
MSEPNPETVAAAVDAFKLRLSEEGVTAMSMVRESITHGSSLVVPDDKFAALRDRAGTALQVAPTQDVFMVGSAKLGFSIKPKRRYMAFGDESDVDLAIVSAGLYKQLWDEARRFSRSGGFWDPDDKSHFKNDHLNGVIKPYVLPNQDSPTQRKLFDLEATLQRERLTDYPVTLAIWHSIETLEDYQAATVLDCQKGLEL